MTTDAQHALTGLLATLGEDKVTELPDGSYQHTFDVGVDLATKPDKTAPMWILSTADPFRVLPDSFRLFRLPFDEWLSAGGWPAPRYARRVARARARSLRNQPLGIHGRRRNAHGRTGVKR